MNQIIAYCGIVCSKCEVYLATINNDDTLREELVKKYTTSDYTPKKEDFYCEGCFKIKGEGCNIRQCASTKEILHCAECKNYNCEKLLIHFKNNIESKKILDELYYKGKAK